MLVIPSRRWRTAQRLYQEVEKLNSKRIRRMFQDSADQMPNKRNEAIVEIGLDMKTKRKLSVVFKVYNRNRREQKKEE